MTLLTVNAFAGCNKCFGVTPDGNVTNVHHIIIALHTGAQLESLEHLRYRI